MSGREGRYLALRFAISARWFFAPLAFLVSITPKLGGGFESMRLELSVLLIVLAINALFRVRLEGLALESAREVTLWYFSAIQAAFDLVYIFAFMMISGQVSTLAIFLVAPVVVSMLALGEAGAWAASLTAPVFLLTATFFSLPDFAYALYGAIPLNELLSRKEVQAALFSSVLMATFFVLLGRFSSLVARYSSQRESDLRIKNEELTSAYDKLSELDELKSQMVSVAAHQLRTPLSGIKWMLKMLSGGDVGPLNSDQQKITSEGYAAVDHLTSLVNEMLQMDRIESGRVKFEIVDTDFSSLLKDAVKELEPKAAEKKIEIVAVLPSEPTIVSVDIENVRGAIENIIDNAIKYSPEGSKVFISVKSNDDTSVLSVKDSGIGIPEKEQSHIFSRFYRASNAVRAETEGTGLGLSIVQSIILRHGGKIWFTSKEGEGTVFFVELPLKHVL